MILGVIPARYCSTRLPGKPLRMLGEKSLIQRVYENASKVRQIDRLVVATDDERIRDHVDSFGGEAVMTDNDLKSGSDRCAAVAESIPCDIVVNIQGDEPFLDAGVVDDCISALRKNPELSVSTAARRGILAAELADPNVVKVIVNHCSEAIYFSRYGIPYRRQADIPIDALPTLVHQGLYVYRRDFLLTFRDLPISPLERAEQLEQLRIIENGYKVHVVETAQDGLGIDTPEDLEKAERILNEREK